MLNDKDVLKVAKYWARRFSNSKNEYDELLSVGYIAGKPLKDVKLLQKWVKFSMLKFIMKNVFLADIDNERPCYHKNIENSIDVNNILTSLNLNDIDGQIIYKRFWLSKTYVDIAKELNRDKYWVRERTLIILETIREILE